MATLKKDELVKLKSETNGVKHFNPQHAENVLNSPHNTGPGAWALPDNSKHKLENGKLIRAANTGTPKGTKE